MYYCISFFFFFSPFVTHKGKKGISALEHQFFFFFLMVLYLVQENNPVMQYNTVGPIFNNISYWSNISSCAKCCFQRKKQHADKSVSLQLCRECVWIVQHDPQDSRSIYLLDLPTVWISFSLHSTVWYIILLFLVCSLWWLNGRNIPHMCCHKKTLESAFCFFAMHISCFGTSHSGTALSERSVTSDSGNILKDSGNIGSLSNGLGMKLMPWSMIDSLFF